MQLDVLRLGFRKADIFTTLAVEEMVAIATAAPPGSAVYHALNEGWTITDHLLATMAEQQGGLVTLQNRMMRPGVTDIRPSRPPSVRDHSKPVVRVDFDVNSVDEFERRRAARRNKKKG